MLSQTFASHARVLLRQGTNLKLALGTAHPSLLCPRKGLIVSVRCAEMASKALEISPNHSSTILLRARIYEAKGDHFNEANDRARIVELEPNNAERRSRLVVALRSAKLYAEALRECDALIKISGGKWAAKTVTKSAVCCPPVCSRCAPV